MSTIAAIDIGSTKAVTVIADADVSGNPRIVAVGQAPCSGIKKGSVVDIDGTAQSVVASVRKAEQMANRKISDVIVSITGEHLSSMPSQGLVPILNPSRTIGREDVHRVINHSKQIALENDSELILAIPRSFKVDGHDGVTRPFGMSGERLEVSTLLVTGKTSQLENLERCVSRAQIEVEHVIPQQIATGLAVLRQSEKDQGVALIDIGGGTTDIAVYVNGSIAYLGMLQLGSQHITSDISILLKTSPQEAERIKLEAGTCKTDGIQDEDAVPVEQVGNSQRRPFPRRVLAEIITARMRELLCLARNEIENDFPFERLAAGIVITGGGSKLPGLAQFAEKTFDGAPVRLGVPEQLPGLGDMLAAPEYATAAGLIKYCLKMREDESVAAEAGDWRKLIRSIGSIFSPRAKEDAKS